MRNKLFVIIQILFSGMLLMLSPSYALGESSTAASDENQIVERLELMISNIDQQLASLPTGKTEGKVVASSQPSDQIELGLDVDSTAPTTDTRPPEYHAAPPAAAAVTTVPPDAAPAEPSSFEKQTEKMMSRFKDEDEIYTGSQQMIKTVPVNVLASELVIDQAFLEAKSVEDPTAIANQSKSAVPFHAKTNADLLDEVLSEDVKNATIDLDFDNAPIGDILHTIGEAGEINFVLDPILRGNTLDLHLKNVPIQDAMVLLADSYNLGFKRVGNALFITSKDRLREESVTHKVVKLRHISAQTVKEATGDILKSVSSHEQGNSVVLYGTPQEIASVENILLHVDVARPQVKLEAKIVEVNKDALKDLGVDWSDSITTNFQESGRPTDLAETEDSSGSPLKVFQFARSPIQFSSVIRMLESENKAKVLANPSIITLNNEESEIFVGDRIPYTITTVTGGVATTEVRFEEPGIRLKITPSIVEDDFVVIKIEPEVSFIFAFRGPNDEYPQTKTRKATAHVRVRNNESFVLGGLLNQEDKKNLFKVPLLGDVPLLGNLFSYETHTVIDSELIISVTPKVISGEVM